MQHLGEQSGPVPWLGTTVDLTLVPVLASQGSARELTLVLWMKDRWQVDQLSYHLGQDPRLWVGSPQHLLHLWTAGAHEEAGPTDQKL